MDVRTCVPPIIFAFLSEERYDVRGSCCSHISRVISTFLYSTFSIGSEIGFHG